MRSGAVGLELAPIGDRASICMAGTGRSIIREVLTLPDENERHVVAEIRSYCIEPVWEHSPPLLPEKEANNPPGCHRSRISGWIVFEKLLQVFDCAYWRIADEE